MSALLESNATRLAAVLGHELRNPLAAAVAGVSAAAEMTEAGDPRSPFLRRALADLARVAALLDRYLELGRTGVVHKAEVDLVEVVLAMAQRHPRLIVQHAASRLIVQGDRVLLERVLDNLIENAVQAEASSIVLALERTADHVVIEVRDDGKGLPAELGARIFDPFVSGTGGSGLGLAVAAEVLESHGGDIEAMPGEHGSCFRIALPAPFRWEP